MEKAEYKRRAIGLLVVFASVLTLIAMWDYPGTNR